MPVPLGHHAPAQFANLPVSVYFPIACALSDSKSATSSTANLSNLSLSCHSKRSLAMKRAGRATQTVAPRGWRRQRRETNASNSGYVYEQRGMTQVLVS